MIKQTFNDIVTDPEIGRDAILNKEFDGFVTDYFLLHYLIRIYKPKRFCEIGCNMGLGTKIIKNAIGDGEVFSLDLPTELAHKSLQSPIMEGRGDKVGSLCDLPFTLLRGDSMTFDFSQIFPIDGWYCDGEHTYKNVYHETTEMLKSDPIIIIYHDTDLPEVLNGVIDATEQYNSNLCCGRRAKEIYRIIDSRISYVISK